MKVKCNKCGYVGDESEFPKGRDFFQHEYIRSCPKCDNGQNPGDASMRMLPSLTGQARPFTYIREPEPEGDSLDKTLYRAGEAS